MVCSSVFKCLNAGCVGVQILKKLLADPLAEEPAAKEALADLSSLFDLLAHMQGLHHIELNMSLARGLDYYTGVIYEAVMLKSWDGGQPQVGSVAAGGRWGGRAKGQGPLPLPHTTKQHSPCFVHFVFLIGSKQKRKQQDVPLCF